MYGGTWNKRVFLLCLILVAVYIGQSISYQVMIFLLRSYNGSGCYRGIL